MVSTILMHSLPLAVAFAYVCGFLYLWYKNVKGE
jgi:hypothetical protein